MQGGRVTEQTGAIRTRPLFIVVALVIVLVICSLLAIRIFSTTVSRQNERFTNSFIEKMVDKDAAATYSMMTKHLQSSVGSQHDWQNTLNDSFGSGPVTFVFDGIESVQSPQAAYGKSATPQQAKYMITLGDGRKYSTYLVVLMSGDSWKIDALNSYLQ